MSRNATNMYDIDAHVAEIYDKIETGADDVELIRKLINGHGRIRILEPFCGTGRILIPLALDGHEIVGLDQAQGMLDRAHAKIARLPEDVRERITLTKSDVTADPWPNDFELVILGGNCFYELATPEEQEGCIVSALISLRPGGYVYIDNDHMEGDLDEDWRRPRVNTDWFPTGTCADGTHLDGTMETIWYDAPRRLVRFRRSVKQTSPDGSTTTKEWIQQKHPVSASEVRAWLEKHAFIIEQMYGDRSANPYVPSSPRAIFLAKKG